VYQVERRCREGRGEDEQSSTWHSLALTCPRTCHLCDDASPTTCQLPSKWQGRWTDAVSGATVSINNTAIHITRRTADDEDQDEVDGLTMSCVQWRTDSTGDENETMLVTVYDAGCRPRYRCVRVVRRSSSLLYLHLSDASSWPLVHSPLNPVDCRAFNFDRWTISPAATAASVTNVSTTSGFLLMLVADRPVSVDCRLPLDVADVLYEAEFVSDGVRTVSTCSGVLSESGQSLTLTLSGCEETVQRRFGESVHRCVESSTVDEDLVIISDDGSTLSCWLFTRRRPSMPLSVYLLVGDQCHAAVVSRSSTSFRPARQLIYTALLSRPRQTSTTTALPRPLTTASDRRTTVRTSKSPRPRPRNVTMVDSDDNEHHQSSSYEDAFVLAVVALLIALFELFILLCRC